MRNWRYCVCLATVFMLLLTACGPEPSDSWDEPLEVSEPLVTDEGLVFLNPALREVQLVEPESSDDSEESEPADVIRRWRDVVCFESRGGDPEPL